MQSLSFDPRSAPSLLFAPQFRPAAAEVDFLTVITLSPGTVSAENYRACRREVELQLWAARCLAGGAEPGIAWTQARVAPARRSMPKVADLPPRRRDGAAALSAARARRLLRMGVDTGA